MGSFPPGLLLIIGAAVVLVAPRWLRHWLFVAVTALVLAQLVWLLDRDAHVEIEWLGLGLNPLRVDSLSLVFGYVFATIALIGGAYALHLRDRGQQTAALLYAGGALGVVFAGDLLTLLAFWELMTVGSVYLVWAGGFGRSAGAGRRYLFVHLVGGSLLLGGILWHLGDGGSLLFNAFGDSGGTAAGGGPAAWMILGGFAINAAIPPMHAWLADAYPEASITGSVFLSALTTKTAVYALARGFPGWEVLIFAGVAMALLGVIFAVLENDVRRLLAYHIISQVGFMVAAVGIGTELAINAAVAHAFAHVLYKGLLFMGVGTVMYATGRRKLTELGGIVGAMRVTFVLYMVGALSISAFPLFSGFVSKSMVIYAAEASHYQWVVFLLYGASVGTFLHTGLKLPYFTWLGPKRDTPVRPVPWSMYAGMGAAGGLCIAIGVYPALLYDLLPFPVAYEPYTAAHVVRSLELLGFTALGFWLLVRKLHGEPAITLDTDWLYRKAATPARELLQRPLEGTFTAAQRVVDRAVALGSRLTTRSDAGWAGALGLTRYGRSRGPDAVVSLLGRPPLGVALGAVLLTFAVVVLIATLR